LNSFLKDSIEILTSPDFGAFEDRKKRFVDEYNKALFEVLETLSKTYKANLRGEKTSKQSLNYNLSKFINKYPRRFINQLEVLILDVDIYSNYQYSFNWLGTESQKKMLHDFLVGNNNESKVFIELENGYIDFNILFSLINILSKEYNKTNWICKGQTGVFQKSA
jgi:hypothetical protein